MVKRFKTPFGQDVNKVHAQEAYLEQMEVQTVAAFMAEKFNSELARYNIVPVAATYVNCSDDVTREGMHTVNHRQVLNCLYTRPNTLHEILPPVVHP